MIRINLKDLTLVAGTVGDGYDLIQVVDASGLEVAAEIVTRDQRRYVVLNP